MLRSLPALVLLAASLGAASAGIAASPHAGASLLPSGTPVAGRSLGRGTHVNAAASARLAVAHPRPRRAASRRALPVHASATTERLAPSSILPVADSSATAAVAGPLVVAQPAPVVTTSFKGIAEQEVCPCEPPDPWIAASPSFIVQTTNGMVRIYNRSGSTLLSEPTWALFAVPPDRFDSDPRILWDAVHNRWVGVLVTYTGDLSDNGLELAVSESSDPTAGWSVFPIEFGGLLPDYPGISTSSSRIVLTSNDFDGATFHAATFLEVDWSNILAGTDLYTSGFTFTGGATSVFRPAIMLSTAPNNPIVYMKGLNVGYFEVSGTAHAPTTVNARDLTLAFGADRFSLPPAPVQPGAAAIAEAVDERPTDAVYRNGSLWFAATADYFDGGRHWDAARWTRVATSANGTAPTSVTDRYSAVPGQDTFMPGVGINADGSAIFVATRTNPTSMFPTTVLGGVMAGGTALPLRTVESSTTAYTGVRWGDFVGVAADPAGNGAVWISHELVADDGTWRTSVIRAVSDGTAPTAPGAVTQALVVPQTLTGNVAVRTSWGAATDADSGVRGYLVEVATDGGPFVGFETTATSITQPLPIGHAYQYRVRAVDAVGLRSVLRGGPIYHPTLYQSTSSTTLSGAWSSQTSAVYSGGTSRFSSSTGASATFTATSARAIGIVTTRATTRGSFRVYVDGVLKTTVSASGSPTIYRRILFQASWPTAGTHTIKIVISGTAGHPRVDLDAFVVLR